MKGLAVLAFWAAVSARADTVFLRNDVRVEGVVEREEDGVLQVRVDVGGWTFLGSREILRVRRASPEENAALEASWKKARDAADAAARAEADFERFQRRQGLTRRNGQWLTRDELDRMLELEKLAALRQGPAAYTPQAYVEPAAPVYVGGISLLVTPAKPRRLREPALPQDSVLFAPRSPPVPWPILNPGPPDFPIRARAFPGTRP